MNNSLLVIKVSEDIEVKTDVTEGVIKEGTLLIGEERNSNFLVQWGGSNISVPKDKAILKNNDELIDSYNTNDSTIGNIIILKDLKIELYKPYLAVSIEKDSTYPIVRKTENTYSILIGNRIIDIEKNATINNAGQKITNEAEKEKSVLDKSSESTEDSMNNTKNSETINPNRQFKTTDFNSYFKVINNQAIVYDNRQSNGLVKIGELLKGETYPIVNDYGNWHRIQFGSHYGYVHKRNTIKGNHKNIHNENNSYQNKGEAFIADKNITVYDNSSGKIVPYAKLQKGFKHEIVSDYGNWYRILLGGRVGYVLKSEVTRQFTNNTEFYEVLEENTPVYDNRFGKLKVVGTLEKGQVFPRKSDYGNWHRIQYGDFYGYVRESQTKPSFGKSIKNINKRYNNSSEKFIAGSNAVVYDNTGKKLEPFMKIKKGVKFPIVSSYGNWYRILVSGKVGYINKENVNGYFSKKSKYFEVRKDGIPVYDNRQDGSLKKIGGLRNGHVFKRTKDYGNWHRIQFGDHYGYVNEKETIAAFKSQIKNYNKKYNNTELKFRTKKDTIAYDNLSGKIVPFASIKKGEKHPVVSSYGDWYRILMANKVGYVRKSDVKIPFTDDIRYFRAKRNTPIYDNRGSGPLKKVGQLLKGQAYQRVKDFGDWHRIKFGNFYGYVKKSDTEPASSYAYKNRTKTDYANGYLIPKKDIFVYDNTVKGPLDPFAKIDKGQKYPVIRDYGNWYEINISGRYGYVRKTDVNAKVMAAMEIVNPRQEYTYKEMRRDINKLKKAYPGLISTKVIGKSVDNRNLYAVKLGTGKNEVFFNGSHHAREWMTTNLLMEMIDEYSQAYAKNDHFGKFNVRKILNNTSIWFVPMVNPDGVSLVQLGAFSADNPNRVVQLNGGSTNFRAWKANVRGVDLNRQYPAGWSTIRYNKPYPGPDNHKGPYPLSEPETKAVYDFTLAHNFKTAVAYHSSGEILYWNYKISGSRKALSRRIANRISAKTGYSLFMPGPNPSGGGYTDWFLQSVKRPGFTPEISPYVRNRPVPLSNYNKIWRQNNTIGLMLALEAYTR